MAFPPNETVSNAALASRRHGRAHRLLTRRKATSLCCALLIIVTTITACGKKDPFDKSAIEKDLKRRTAQSLYDEAEKFKYDAPADGRLNDAQIATFVQMEKLAAVIREVARQGADEHVDAASVADSRFGRMSESFAAVGSLRAYATAELRASLDLGLNPHEQQWIDKQIAACIGVIQVSAGYDRAVAAKKEELDREPDPVIAERLRPAYDQAVAARESWEGTQDAAVLANAKMVLAHREELKAAYPRLADLP